MQAWQNLIPEKSDTRNGDVYSTPLPEIDADYGYIIEWLREAGSVCYADSRLIPLSNSEINAWADGMHVQLTRFEFSTLRRMSEAYCAIANDKKSECPVEHSEEALEAVSLENMNSWLAIAKKG